MPQFNLKTAFTVDQLQLLYATGTNVVVAKSINGQANVAWQVFMPLQNNLLSWKEEYGIYASNTDIQNGAVLNQFTNTPSDATIGSMYILQPYGAITGPAGPGYPDAYTLTNQFNGKNYVTVGLYQNANVNGSDITRNAVSATPLLMQSTAVMTPSTTINIWLQSQVISNSVVTRVTSPITVLNFSDSTTEISIAYDSSSGKFIPAKNDALKGTSRSFDYIEPTL